MVGHLSASVRATPVIAASAGLTARWEKSSPRAPAPPARASPPEEAFVDSRADLTARWERSHPRPPSPPARASPPDDAFVGSPPGPPTMTRGEQFRQNVLDHGPSKDGASSRSNLSGEPQSAHSATVRLVHFRKPIMPSRPSDRAAAWEEVLERLTMFLQNPWNLHHLLSVPVLRCLETVWSCLYSLISP